MSAAIHPFPGRDPNRPLSTAGEDLLADLAAAVGAPRREHPAGRARPTSRPTARRPLTVVRDGVEVVVPPVATVGAARRGGANDLVTTAADPSPVARRRRLLALAFVTVLVAVFVAAVSGMSQASADGDPATAGTVVVEGGDTLWGIASDLTPAGDDVRDTVALLLDANDLSSPTVSVGTVLRVPDLPN